MLDRLVSVLQIAEDNDLVVIPTLFTGHMNGLNWFPPWMLMASTEEHQLKVFSQNKVRNNKPRNPYSDPEVMEAQIFFLRELLSAVSGHPALFAWNLGNEPSLWAVPPDEFSAKLWLQVMTETLKEKNNSVSVTVGFGVGDLAANWGLTLKMFARHLDYVGIRVNLQKIAWSEKVLDRAVLPFIGSVTEWLAGKPVFVLDFGLPTIPTVQDRSSRMIRNEEGLSLISEDDVAEFTDGALAQLSRFNIHGVFWKSFGDYHPSIWSWPPLNMNVEERFKGILRHDQTLKPAAAAFKSAVAERPEVEPSRDWLDMPEEDFYKNPKSGLSRLYRRFRECHELG